MKEHKFLNLSFKADSIDEKEGVIEGYAAVFGNVDLGLDVIEHGAFSKTIAESGGKWPILKDHDPSKRIGYNMQASEDERGLKIVEKLALDTQMGREAFVLSKMAHELGAKDGLSIGYSVIQAEPDKGNQRIRRLKELRMWEHSHVTFPMNTEAQSRMAKQFKSMAEAENSLGAFVDAFFHALENLGHKHTEVVEALRDRGAATNSIEPKEILHSIDQVNSFLESIKQQKTEV